jgi:hypothetical protein
MKGEHMQLGTTVLGRTDQHFDEENGELRPTVGIWEQSMCNI